MASVQLLLLLFYILPYTVNGCLKVRHQNPWMKKCKCNVNIFNQEDVRDNEGGRYLANQKIWEPVVTSDDDCFLAVNCIPVAGVSSFFTVLFRSNGAPHYINRVVGNVSTFVPQPRNIGDLTCSEDTDGSWQWFFHGSPIYDFSFACVSDMDSCSCDPIEIMSDYTTRMPNVPSQCDFFTSSCQSTEQVPFILNGETAINSGSLLPWYSTQYEDLFCVKKDDGSFKWYFSNAELEYPKTVCYSNEEYYDEPATDYCGVFQVINHVNQLSSHYRKGYYQNATFGANNWQRGYYESFDITCEEGFDPVIFTTNNEPLVLPKSNPTVKCTYNPMTNELRIWIANGTRLISPAASCARLEITPPIEMNGCECPQIQYISQMEIINMGGYSAYLGRRYTTSLPVSVSDKCLVSFNGSDLFKIFDFHAVLFRDEAPPVIMRRFLPSDQDHRNVTLQDLTCRKVGEIYQWNYKDSKITDQTLYLAFQANWGGCLCSEFKVDDTVTMTKLEGSCDTMKLKCRNPLHGIEVSYKAKSGPNVGSQAVIRSPSAELTPVGPYCNYDTWYINGIEVENPQASCTETPTESAYSNFAKTCPCSYPDRFSSPSEANFTSFWNKFSSYYPGSEAFKNREAPYAVNPRFNTDGCRITYSCLEDDTFVVFSMNFDPMIYPAGSAPDMRCVSPPMAQNTVSERYWWIDNVMVSMSVFACFLRDEEIDNPEIKMNGCKCPQIKYIDEDEIRNLGEYSSYLAEKSTVSPVVTVNRKCEVAVDESNIIVTNHSIMLFREKAPPLMMRRYTFGSTPGINTLPIKLSELTCARNGNSYEWQYQNVKVSDTPIYITIQNDSPTCSCAPFTVFPSVTSTPVENSCDTFQMTCTDPTYAFWFYALIDASFTLEFISMVPLNDFTFTATSCIDNRWYLNGIPFEHPTVECSSKPGNEAGYWEFSESCSCNPLYAMTPQNWEFYKDFTLPFNKKGLFKNRNATEGIFVYDRESCTGNYVCGNDEELVIMSNEYEPMVFSSNDLSGISCVSPPYAQSRKTEKYWWVDGVMISVPVVVCLPRIDENPIQMNECQCPKLKHIDQNGISRLAESAYLNNRETFRPKVTVSDSCEVIVDASEMEIDNFHLMLFREDAPPVFMRRFYNGTDKKSPVALNNLVCQRTDGTFQWTYNNLKITDKTLYIALQSNQESCECEEFEVNPNKITMTKHEGQCDILRFQCVNSADWEGPLLLNSPPGDAPYHVTKSFGNSWEMLSATCVNSQWQFNGLPLTSPSISCGDPFANGIDLDYEPFSANCYCSQMVRHDFRAETETEFWDSFTNQYDHKGEYRHKRTVAKDVEQYFYQNCSANLNCWKYQTDLVVFSLNHDPIVYPSGVGPRTECVPHPSATYPRSDRYWWIDDRMLLMPRYACIEREISCKCDKLYGTAPVDLSRYAQSEYLKDRQQFTPSWEVSPTCDVSVNISASTVDNFFLYMTRYQQDPLFIRRFTSATNRNELVPLPEFKCIEVGDNYFLWHHDQVPFGRDVQQVLISDEECGCAPFYASGAVITPVDGSCNALRIQCTNPNFSINLWETVLPVAEFASSDINVAEATCVNRAWYYNGLRIGIPEAYCLNSTKTIMEGKCSCPKITSMDFPASLLNGSSWPQRVEMYRIPPEFRSKTSVGGTMSWDDDTCKVTLSCAPGQTIAVLSRNKNFLAFPPGTVPDVHCSPLLATSAFSGIPNKQMWINGELRLSTYFTCYD